MLNRNAFFALLLATAVAGSAAAAPAKRESLSRWVPKGPTVTDHVPQLDGPVTTQTDLQGRVWAAWAYRAGGEFDIAVSSREAGTADWSAPLFFGRRNGTDEVAPAIAVDSRGTIYVAFATTSTSRVSVAVLPAGSLVWSEPVIVSGTDAAETPALLVVGDRLIVAYRTADGVAVVDFPTVGSGNHTDGINDGPEPFDPLGVREHRTRTDSTPTANTNP